MDEPMEKGDSIPPTANPPDHSDKPIVVGFWFRFLADSLDVGLLGIVGYAAAFVLKDVVYELGEQGWWIGLCITFVYTGVLQSTIGNGQTLAKKFLNIQVLKRDGSFMSLPESFLRYAVIAFIAYNGWIGSGLVATFPFLQNVAFNTAHVLLVAFCLCGVIFLVPFHPLKQGLHDLLVDTVVVRKGRFTREALELLQDDQKAKRAYAITMCAFLIFVGGFLWLSLSEPEIPEMDQMKAIKDSVERSTILTHVGVTKRWNRSEKETTTSFILSAYLVKSKFDDEELVSREAGRSVQLAVAILPAIQNYNMIEVNVRSGFNIGIASLDINRSLRFSSDGKEIK